MSKPMNEKDSRAQLIGWARKYGCEEDLLKLFARYDTLLRNCKNDEERKAIQAMAVMEVNQFFGKTTLNVKYSDGSSIVIGADNNLIKDS
jgi:hypothetical protein